MSSLPASSHPPILDTHIHLFNQARYSHLSWLTQEHPLYANHFVAEYASCIPSELKPAHRGFIFVETDCRYSDPPCNNPSPAHLAKAWAYVLQEFSVVYEYSQAGCTDGMIPVRGIVPWAPVHLGPRMLDRYLEKLCAIGGVNLDGNTGKVDQRKSILKGFRQLLQDKSKGYMLHEDFIAGVKWIGDKGLAFEIGVDTRGTGLWQLEELVTFLDRLGENAPTLIINHLGKPDLHINPCKVSSNKTFLTYATLLRKISSHPKTVMKLSGVFSELPPLPPAASPAKSTPLPPSLSPSATQIIDQIFPWAATAFSCFSSSRIIWGSDWPVCNVLYPAREGEPSGGSSKVRNGDAWNAWVVLTGMLLEKMVGEGVLGVGAQGGDGLRKMMEGVWGGNGARVYGVEWKE